MDNDEIEARVKRVITEHLGVDEEKLKPDALLIDDIGADSLDCIEVIMALEEEFTCEIPDEEAEKCLTVGDVITLIKCKIPKAA